MNKLHSRITRDESGAVLVTVVVVMLVGFIIAASVAASVMFVVKDNYSNRGRTQAFIAAESGRDVAVAALTAGCSATSFTGTDPIYSTTIYSTAGNQPSSSSDAGVAVGCPTSTSRYVVIKSTGTGPNGATVTTDSVYPWQVTYSQQPGGVVTYFSGGFTAGVTHYTGDLVLRDGDWGCNVSGILDGDLYVLSGNVSFSKQCTVNGDIWSNGNVTNNSQQVTITGSVTTNGFASFTANGGTKIGKNISAKGQVTLSNQGSDVGTVGGSISSRNSVTVGSNWTVTGPVTQNSTTDPVFDPTLAWLKAATKWIDLDNTGWGTKYTATNVCDLIKNNPSPTITSLLEAAGTRLVFDFTSCSLGNGNESVTIALGNVNLARDAVFIVKPTTTLTVNLTGTIAGGTGTKQLLFIHSDSSRAYTNGEPVPNCGNGNQNDTFNASGAFTGDVRLMYYTPCGMTGTATSTFSGQLYANDTTHLHAAAYTCQSMSWSPAFDQLGCKIKGDGSISQGSLIQRLGDLVYQTEK
ncbi:hypothetical protein AAIB33_04025 [Microbacterium sp. AZCO]|uniref:hypothetical protein n=1 Tax=Microbacterium sp. AZCO TaxID=3142976 RepID=UPI0031F4373B